MRAKESLRPRRLESLSERNFITFVKGNTARDRRNRLSPSACPRRVGRASDCRRHRVEVFPRECDGRRSAITRPDSAVTGMFPGHVRAGRTVRSNVKITGPVREGRSQGEHIARQGDKRLRIDLRQQEGQRTPGCHGDKKDLEEV